MSDLRLVSANYLSVSLTQPWGTKTVAQIWNGTTGSSRGKEGKMGINCGNRRKRGRNDAALWEANLFSCSAVKPGMCTMCVPRLQ